MNDVPSSDAPSSDDPRWVGWTMFARFVRWSIPSLRAWRPWSARRALLLALALPAFFLLQIVHWLGFLLDDVFFRGYRRVAIEEPLFIVGLPRSGTSFFQRVLALDDRNTTMRLWHLLLAPSVTERTIWGGLIRVDGMLGSPARGLLGWSGRGLTAWMDDVHPVSLTEPEEDFLLLLPGFASFLLVLAFPLHPEVWRLSRMDEWSARERRVVMAFYRSCLRRHLYVERRSGPADLWLLSKNPSFTGAVLSLAEAFPDARFVCLVRDPRDGVPSQLSAVRAGMAAFGADVRSPEIRDRFVGMMEHYANHALRVEGRLGPGHWRFVTLDAMRRDLGGSVETVYGAFGRRMSETFRARVRVAAEEARQHRSGHAYTAGDLGVTSDELDRRFAAFSERFAFGVEARTDGASPSGGHS